MDGKTCEGNKAWEKGLKRLSDMELLAIPNRPFSGKPIQIVVGKNPPDGDYREPLTKSELKLLRKVVPGLSIRVVDSKPELSDPRLELFLREHYHMGDSHISDLTWSNVFDACKNYVKTQKKKKGAQAEIHETNANTEPLSDKALAVLNLLQELSPNKALTGPQILKELDNKNIIIDQSTLTKSIIPALKPHGVKNKRRIGYYLEKNS